MRKFTALFGGLFFLFSGLQANPGDTTIVKTFDFNSPNSQGVHTPRRGTFLFPDGSKSYEKILMYYTLKCDAATTGDSYDCGEWDYLTYSFAYWNTGTLDSTELTQNEFEYAQDSPTMLDYLLTPTYYVQQKAQTNRVITATNSLNTASFTSGSTQSTSILGVNAKNHRSQFIYTASELTNAGLQNQAITGIQLDLSGMATHGFEEFVIRIKHSLKSELTPNDYENDGFTEVYNGVLALNGSGLTSIQFQQDFMWNGASNLVVDLATKNHISLGVAALNAETTGTNSGIEFAENEGTVYFFNKSEIELPLTNIDQAAQEITIAFWQYGDPSQPTNNSIIEGRNSKNERVLNIHMPWGNGNVYWDAGNDFGYDRIEKGATAASYKGAWNHWAFTKNATTGSMEIYLNGTLWHSGTNKNRAMDGITKLVVGGNAAPTQGNFYKGNLDEFSIWGKALNASEIQEIMANGVSTNTPNFNDLIIHHDFNDVSNGILTENTKNGSNSLLSGTPERLVPSGAELFHNISQLTIRPNIVFEQGSYTYQNITNVYNDTIYNNPRDLKLFQNAANRGVPTDTLAVWKAGYQYVLDTNNQKIDSILFAGTQSITNQAHTYFSEPFEKVVKVELGRYITPYGIGLTLGPNGFTWVFDVTEYNHVLRDSLFLEVGNQQELLDLQFVFIEGTPPRDVIQFDQLVGATSYQYKDIFQDNVLKAQTVNLRSDASEFMVRTRTSGHGFGGDSENCAEFCPKRHRLKVDGIQRFEWLLWNKCGENPVYPQGGTWIYDRAGWCPGAIVDHYDHIITPYVSAGGTASLDYDVQGYPTNGGYGNYVVTMQLFQMGAINHQYDMRITNVVAPNNWEFYGRYNPICNNPKVEIQNAGSEQITEATIYYTVEGTGKVLSHTWKGFLNFLEKTEVDLPTSGYDLFNGMTAPKFKVWIAAPNKQTDEYALNDTMTTTFEVPQLLPEKITLWYRVNAAPNEFSWKIVNDQNQIVHQSSSLTANATYKDTLDLPQGCYTLILTDTDCDGLSFFANNDGGGYFRVHPATTIGAAYHTFNPNFGCSNEFHFTVGFPLSVETPKAFKNLDVFPNPTTGEITIEYANSNRENATIQLYDLSGRVLAEFQTLNQEFTTKKLDLSAQPKGIYLIKSTTASGVDTKKVILQ